MFKKLLVLSLLLCACNFTLQGEAFNKNNYISVNHPQLHALFNKIQQVPSAKNLLMRVQNQGSIRIIQSNDPLARQFGAFWDSDNRVIHMDVSPQRSEGELIGSLIFELQNAFANDKIEHLHSLASQKAISKGRYVESLERLEYENSIHAAKIAEEGIQLGHFPRDARLHTYPSFEEHFRIQKIGKHSDWIAEMYDQLGRN